jgi:hypothetical protein
MGILPTTLTNYHGDIAMISWELPWNFPMKSSEFPIEK